MSAVEEVLASNQIMNCALRHAEELDRLRAEVERLRRRSMPVAWMVVNVDGQDAFVTSDPSCISAGQKALPLYTDAGDVADLSLLAEILHCGPHTPYAKLLEVARGAVKRAEESEAEIERLRKAHAGYCLHMVRLGVTEFGTLDEAIDKLAEAAKGTK